ncbi:hypothetical protein IRJ34_07300 [Paenarthrobacter sp. GOM3]|uniref:hypothetical protein n=1 Tax=Paenarthrobacter sp. GOM3 TaxID=2782567 RepID=UPI001BA6D776|nr:hypothetical protein [Paenarthrobacter sp. GOM3]WOH20122.1 hypothetical protein IRJ34_07300 [Paenarthrobacter sp. GOM3]
MAWKVFSVSTSTWGDRIEVPADTFSGGRQLNATSPGAATFLTKNAKVREVVTPVTMAKLRRALVVEWNRIPVYAGLIVDTDRDVFTGVLEVQLADLWWIWKSRHVLPMHGAGVEKLPPLVFTGHLATIAKKAIQEGMDAAPLARYDLPIVWEDDLPGPYTREYYGYKFPSVADALDELIKTDGGPDIDFPPQWAPDFKLQWAMRSGNLVGGYWEWDATTKKTDIIGIKEKGSGANVANKVIGTGEGSGEDILVKAEESFATSDFPALERVVSYSGISNRDQLAARARADVEAQNEPTQQLSVSIRPDGAVAPSELLLGGTVRVNLKEAFYVPNGWSDWRLLGFTFSEDSVDLQLQQQGG